MEWYRIHIEHKMVNTILFYFNIKYSLQCLLDIVKKFKLNIDKICFFNKINV